MCKTKTKKMEETKQNLDSYPPSPEIDTLLHKLKPNIEDVTKTKHAVLHPKQTYSIELKKLDFFKNHIEWCTAVPQVCKN